MADPGSWAFRVNKQRSLHSRQNTSHCFMPCDQRQINTFWKSKSDRGQSLIPPPSMHLSLPNAMPNALFLPQLPLSLQSNKSASPLPLLARAAVRTHVRLFRWKLGRCSLDPLNCKLAIYSVSSSILQDFPSLLYFDGFVWYPSTHTCPFKEDVIWEAV